MGDPRSPLTMSVATAWRRVRYRELRDAVLRPRVLKLLLGVVAACCLLVACLPDGTLGYWHAVYADHEFGDGALSSPTHMHRLMDSDFIDAIRRSRVRRAAPLPKAEDLLAPLLDVEKLRGAATSSDVTYQLAKTKALLGYLLSIVDSTAHWKFTNNNAEAILPHRPFCIVELTSPSGREHAGTAQPPAAVESVADEDIGSPPLLPLLSPLLRPHNVAGVHSATLLGGPAPSARSAGPWGWQKYLRHPFGPVSGREGSPSPHGFLVQRDAFFQPPLWALFDASSAAVATAPAPSSLRLLLRAYITLAGERSSATHTAGGGVGTPRALPSKEPSAASLTRAAAAVGAGNPGSDAAEERTRRALRDPHAPGPRADGTIADVVVLSSAWSALDALCADGAGRAENRSAASASALELLARQLLLSADSTAVCGSREFFETLLVLLVQCTDEALVIELPDPFAPSTAADRSAPSAYAALSERLVRWYALHAVTSTSPLFGSTAPRDGSPTRVVAQAEIGMGSAAVRSAAARASANAALSFRADSPHRLRSRTIDNMGALLEEILASYGLFYRAVQLIADDGWRVGRQWQSGAQRHRASGPPAAPRVVYAITADHRQQWFKKRVVQLPILAVLGQREFWEGLR